MLPMSDSPFDLSASGAERRERLRRVTDDVVTDDAGRPAGYQHMKDVMDLRDDEFRRPIPAKRLRRLLAVPATADLEDAMARMRTYGAHVALSVDDRGEPLGLLFLEDVLEVLIGEVDDAA